VLRPNPAEVEAIHWLSAAEMLSHADLLESNRAFLEGVLDGTIALDDWASD
jgi:hypothetical protein